MNQLNPTLTPHTLGQAVALILSWLDEDESPAVTTKNTPAPAPPSARPKTKQRKMRNVSKTN